MDPELERWLSELVSNGTVGSRSEVIDFAVTFLKWAVDQFDISKESLQQKYPDMAFPITHKFLKEALGDTDEAVKFLKGLMSVRQLIP